MNRLELRKLIRENLEISELELAMDGLLNRLSFIMENEEISLAEEEMDELFNNFISGAKKAATNVKTRATQAYNTAQKKGIVQGVQQFGSSVKRDFNKGQIDSIVKQIKDLNAQYQTLTGKPYAQLHRGFYHGPAKQQQPAKVNQPGAVQKPKTAPAGKVRAQPNGKNTVQTSGDIKQAAE